MRVLVVDDDAGQLGLLKALLEGWGHHVAMAADGEAGLAQAETFRPQVMITDLHMPKVDGFQLMQRLRSEQALPPTIVLTGFGSVEVAVETVHKFGAFWFLEKPVKAESLRVLVDRATSQAALTEATNHLTSASQTVLNGFMFYSYLYSKGEGHF